MPSPCRATHKSRPAARLWSSPVRFLPPLSQALKKSSPGLTPSGYARTLCAFEVAVWPRCRRVKGRKGCPESISPTVVCLHVTAHARGSCLHVTAHVRGSPTSCDSCPYSRHDQSHALTTQEIKDIRNAKKTREIIFFWLPAALLSTFTFYYEATTPLRTRSSPHLFYIVVLLVEGHARTHGPQPIVWGVQPWLVLQAARAVPRACPLYVCVQLCVGRCPSPTWSFLS